MRQIESFGWKIDRPHASRICNGTFLPFLSLSRSSSPRPSSPVRMGDYFMIDEAMMTIQKCRIETERNEMTVTWWQ